MLLSLMNMLIFGSAGFLLMYIFYRPHLIRFLQTQKITGSLLPIPYILGLYAIGTTAAFIFADNKDFIEPLTIMRAFLPIGLAALIYIAFLFFDISPLFYTTVALSVGISVWLQPIGIAMADFALPPYILQIILFIFCLLFCLGMRIFNILPHSFIVASTSIMAGICVLCIVGASPLFVALCAATLSGILCAFLSLNYYDIKMDFDDGTCIVISYLICNLMLLNWGEFSFPSCAIFTMLLWAELAVAVYRKYILSSDGKISENTNIYAATEIHTLQSLSGSMFRICSVLLFIGWFQLFSVNQYSLILVSFCLALWLGNSLRRTQSESLKEVNNEFVTELKKNFEETKNLLFRNKKDKK